MVELWKAYTMATVDDDGEMGFFEGSIYFFQNLVGFWEKRKKAGKPTAIKDVWRYFSKEDKEKDHSIICFCSFYRNGTIQDIQVAENGRKFITITYNE